MKGMFIYALVSLLSGLVLMGNQSSFARSESDIEATIDSVVLDGNLGKTRLQIEVSVEIVGNSEVEARQSHFPLFGANPTQDGCSQRVVRSAHIILSGIKVPIPSEALQDLFDPAFVNTIRLSRQDDIIAISWAGGSGERAYRCVFYAKGQQFIKREVYQLDNQAIEKVFTKTLNR